ncbi:MAG: TIGR02147 family protein [Oligoflexales bacterium]
MSQSNSDIFHYNDCSAFLRAKAEWNKSKKERGLSAKQWADRLGYRSAQSVSMVLTGERLPSREMTHKLAQDLGLSEKEKRYFELLVDYQALKRRGKDTGPVVDQIDKVNPHFRNHLSVDDSVLRYVGEWYHLVVKQLVNCPGFKADPKWIKERLRGKITEHQATQALVALEKIGLIEKWKKSYRTKGAIKSAFDVPNPVLRGFHKQMLDKAKESVDEQGVAEREIVAITIQMAASRIDEAKNEIRSFLERFNKKFYDKGAESVFQLNTQLFSHTENKEQI